MQTISYGDQQVSLLNNWIAVLQAHGDARTRLLSDENGLGAGAACYERRCKKVIFLE